MKLSIEFSDKELAAAKELGFGSPSDFAWTALWLKCRALNWSCDTCKYYNQAPEFNCFKNARARAVTSLMDIGGMLEG